MPTAYDSYLHPSDKLFGRFSIKEITQRTCQPAQVSQAAVWGLGCFFSSGFFPPSFDARAAFLFLQLAAAAMVSPVPQQGSPKSSTTGSTQALSNPCQLKALAKQE